MGQSYLFFDTETTGLPTYRDASLNQIDDWPHLVQIAWALYDDTTLREARSHIICPDGYEIPDEAASVHGITTEKAVEDGEAIEQVLGDFESAFIKTDYVVAHNMQFDANVVMAEYARMGKDRFLGGRGHICTMKRSTRYCGIKRQWGYKWPTLEELHQKLFGEGIDGAHDALVDVNACARCFFKLRQSGIISEGLPLK